MDFSKLKIEGLSKEDKKLVNEHAGKSIEDLQAAGLTPKGEETLRAFVANVKPYVAKNKPLIPAQVRQQPMQGATRSTNKARAADRAIVHNERTGLDVVMSAKAAERVAGKLNKPRQMGKDSRYNQAGQVYRKVG